MARQYTREFKTQVCKLVVEDNINIKIVAEKFGLNVVMVYRWVSEFQTYGNEAFVGTGNLRPEEAKLKKALQENERLKQEIEILKKAAAYFAKAKQ